MNEEILMSWMRDLFPLNRSLSGEGNRETLNYLKRLIPRMTIESFPSGDKVFDWTIPDEWNAVDAWIELPDGTKIAELKKNNLHLVGETCGASLPIYCVWMVAEKLLIYVRCFIW